MSKSAATAENAAVEGGNASPTSQDLRQLFLETVVESGDALTDVDDTLNHAHFASPELDIDLPLKSIINPSTPEPEPESLSHKHTLQSSQLADLRPFHEPEGTRPEACNTRPDKLFGNHSLDDKPNSLDAEEHRSQPANSNGIRPGLQLQHDERGRLSLSLPETAHVLPLFEASEVNVTKYLPRNKCHNSIAYSISEDRSASSPTSSLKHIKMEYLQSSLRGSDGSNLSTTQENDPSAYARYQLAVADAIRSQPLSEGAISQPSTKAKNFDSAQRPWNRREWGTSNDTGKSYGAGETGHVTLQYEVPTGQREDCPEDEEDSVSLPADLGDCLATFDPKTPASKTLFENTGTVMRPSQLFAATQPSSIAFRGPLGEDITSSRPSPELYRNVRHTKHSASSPLCRRAGDFPQSVVEAIGEISSPVHSPQHSTTNEEDAYIPPQHDASSSIINSRGRSSLMSATLRRAMPEPHGTYLSRMESQERRHRTSLSDNETESDDDFFDREAEMSRRARLRKEEAARDLAVVRTSRPSASSTSDLVEVPSTNKSRRQSMQEEQVPQREGADVGGSRSQYELQPDDQREITIADSQRMPSGLVAAHITQQDVLTEADGDSTDQMPQQSVPSDEADGAGWHDQLPGLEAGSVASLSDRDSSVTPPKEPTTKALMEVSGNVGTPSGHKPLLLSGDDALVPETSPLQAHQRHYIGLDGQSQPAASITDCDEVLNPFTQDAEYSAMINLASPSPSKPAQRSTRRLPGIRSHATISVGSSGQSKACNSEIHGQVLKKITASASLEAPLNLPDATEDAMDCVTISSFPVVDRSNAAILQHHIENKTSPSDGQGDNTIIVSPAAEEPPAHVLRSADQVKGSSRCLRKTNVVGKLSQKGLGNVNKRASKPSTEKSADRATSDYMAPASTIDIGTRALRRMSVDAKLKKAESLEPDQPRTPLATKRRKTTTSLALEVGLFSKMAFSVSYVAHEDEKQRVMRHIKQNGGRILESGFDELFDMAVSGVPSPLKSSGDSSTIEGRLTLGSEAQETGFTCLIADLHSRKAKYMQALALGLPCLSGKWIENCVVQGKILDWSAYMLAAGESSFLGGAVRSRTLVPYSAATASFEDSFASRALLLAGKSILLIMGRGKNVEERKKAYLFLTQALGARRVKRVISNQETRKVLLEDEGKNLRWDFIYVDEKVQDADKAIFGSGPSRKRKRISTVSVDAEDPTPKRVRLISDEFVVQSLILGKLLEE